MHQHGAVGLEGQGCGHEGWLLVAQQAGAQALAPLVQDSRWILLLVAGIGGREPRAELLAGSHGGHEAGGGLGHPGVLWVVRLAPQAPVGGTADQGGVVFIRGLCLDGWDCEKSTWGAPFLVNCRCAHRISGQRSGTCPWASEWVGEIVGLSHLLASGKRLPVQPS